MYRRSLRIFLFTCGVLLLLATFIPWVLGSFMILAAGSGESVSVRNTGMVTCPELLEWTSWADGPGDVCHRHPAFTVRDDLRDAEIVAHRVGRDSKLFSVLTFYQAKYRYPDGRIEVAPADGPKSLVSVNRGLAAICSISAFVAGLFSFHFATRHKVSS
jgi:hypothetical protein